MEEPPRTSLADAGDLEENASHHIRGALPLVEGGGAKHSPPGGTGEKIIENHENHDFWKSSDIILSRINQEHS